MIKTETYFIGEREFTRTYSDSGRYVVRDGVSYEEACDPSEFGRTYTEGDPIPEDENSTAEEILNIVLGEDQNDRKEESIPDTGED